MKDRDFLMWLHRRLEHVHGEDKYFDYMHKLRAIITFMPGEQETLNNCPWNSLEELENFFARKKSTDPVLFV